MSPQAIFKVGYTNNKDNFTLFAAESSCRDKLPYNSSVIPTISVGPGPPLPGRGFVQLTPNYGLVVNYSTDNKLQAEG